MPAEHHDRATSYATAAVGTGLGALLLRWTPATWQAGTQPHATTEALVAGLALAVGWLLVLRLVAATLAAAVGLLPGAVGRAGRVLSVRLTPALLRRVVQGLVSVSVAAGPLATGGASWAAQPGSGLPDLDRVASVPASAPQSPARSTTSASPTPASPQPAVPVLQTPVLLPPVAEVTVQPGDSLWRIAAEHLPPGHSDSDVARAWPGWYAANRSVIGADPRVIRPGQRLVVPPVTSGAQS